MHSFFSFFFTLLFNFFDHQLYLLIFLYFEPRENFKLALNKFGIFFFNQIPRSCPIISIRTISVEGEAINLRQQIDLKVAKIPGVEFLISSLTGTENNSKSKKSASNRDEQQKQIKKGVAYFIVVRQENVEDKIRQVIASLGFRSLVTYIRPRGEDRSSSEKSLRKLCCVLKV